jgi:hypothetical protein
MNIIETQFRYIPDKDDVNSVLYSLKSEGTLDIFDGDLFEEDTRDSEMLDDELDNVSQI